MSINKYMRAALKALSNADIDVKSNYKLIRQIERAAKKSRLNFRYNTIEYYIADGGGDMPISVRIFTPDGEETELSDAISNFPVIVFFHGGGWVTGDIDSYEKLCMTAAKKTLHVVVAVEYRLAPENPFPAALEDCYRVVKAVLEWREEYRPKSKDIPEHVALMGDSAGGNLAAAVSLYMRDRGERTAEKQILIYPVVYGDHSESSVFPSVHENGTDYLLTSRRVCDYTDLYCSKLSDRDSPYFAPLLATDYSNQPDTLILTAQYDLLRDEGEEYGRRLKETGNHVVVHRIKDALHGYFSLPSHFSAVKESYEIINKFLWEREDTEL